MLLILQTVLSARHLDFYGMEYRENDQKIIFNGLFFSSNLVYFAKNRAH